MPPARGGERGIRTLDADFSTYALSRRRAFDRSAISPRISKRRILANRARAAFVIAYPPPQRRERKDKKMQATSPATAAMPRARRVCDYRRGHSRLVDGVAFGDGARARRRHFGRRQNRHRRGRERHRLRRCAQQLFSISDARIDGAQRRRVGIRSGGFRLSRRRLFANLARFDARRNRKNPRRTARHRLRIDSHRRRQRSGRLYEIDFSRLARRREVDSVLHEKRGGFANNIASVRGLAAKAEALGVKIISGATVTGFARESGSSAVPSRRHRQRDDRMRASYRRGRALG